MMRFPRRISFRRHEVPRAYSLLTTGTFFVSFSNDEILQDARLHVGITPPRVTSTLAMPSAFSQLDAVRRDIETFTRRWTFSTLDAFRQHDIFAAPWRASFQAFCRHLR